LSPSVTVLGWEATIDSWWVQAELALAMGLQPAAVAEFGSLSRPCKTKEGR
jgi:hypothetical protein